MRGKPWLRDRRWVTVARRSAPPRARPEGIGMSCWRRASPLLLLLAACRGASPPAVSPAASRAAFTHGMVNVGGLSFHMHCVGIGTPSIVMDAGGGDDGTSWSLVQPEISRSTRTCVYDRLGTGYSSPAPKPHTSRQIIGELHALLQTAGIA